MSKNVTFWIGQFGISIWTFSTLLVKFICDLEFGEHVGAFLRVWLFLLFQICFWISMILQNGVLETACRVLLFNNIRV